MNRQENEFKFQAVTCAAAFRSDGNGCRLCPTDNTASYDDMRNSSESPWGSMTLRVLAGLLWLAWQAMRVPVLALLTILEPIASTVLVAAALLGTLTAIFWKLASSRPDFPFLGTLALSVGCFLLLALYHAAIRLLSGRLERPLR